MPSSIPYDPSLVLGSIVHPEVIDRVIKISNIQAKADAAQRKLNDELALKRSLDLTLVELTSMQQFSADALVNGQDENPERAQVKALRKKIADVKKNVFQYANDYADAKTTSLVEVAKVMNADADKEGSDGTGMVQAEMESPIDYVKTAIKKMPFAADSMTMDAQYFNFDRNSQSSHSMAASIKSFLEVSVKGAFGTGEASGRIANNAARQANHQYENHDIIGTLVISVNCTHKDAAFLAPMVMDVEKAVNSWNQIYPDDKLDTSKPAEMAKIALGRAKSKSGGKEDKEKHLTLVSGASYGSSFVAMVHILNNTETSSGQSMFSTAAQVSGEASRGWLLAKVTVSGGMDASYSSSLKSLLSTQNIQCHCNIVTMGSIPSIVSNQVGTAVKQFDKFDPSESMGKLAELQNAGAEAIDSAKIGNFQSTKIKSVLSGLAPLDSDGNKMLDINTAMTALDDYVKKALDGNIGVPINYYLKTLDKEEIAHLWVDKTYPFYFSEYLGQASSNGNGSANGQEKKEAETADA